MFLLLFFLWVLIHSIVITVDGLNDHLQKADCILILGNTVNKDGTLSHRLQARVDKGYELYQKKYASKIIVSGGLGQEGYYEAREMKKYLVSKGIPAQDIIADEQAKTTHETMINYIPIARENNFHSVIVVSQFFHLTRSRAMLHSEGIQNVYDAHADYFEGRDVYAVLREFVAFYGFLLKRIIS
ncbi:MAG TPA: YdcF family protein [Cytophagaceae bacterium]|nr:YdcF family protein [Cytophagaceae bacterium]